MHGSETGKQAAIHLAYLPFDLAEQMNSLLSMLTSTGNGTGQLVLHVVNGHVASIDCSTRIHRRPPHKTRLRAL